MARVFTISFDFWGERHTAMVTLCEKQSDVPTCHIKLFNTELYSIIPEGKIIFSFNDKGLPPQIQNHIAEELYVNLRQSLTSYLSYKPTTAVR